MILDPRSVGQRFTSRLHEPRTASILGAALGVSFAMCFVTGLYSHLLLDPVAWLDLPTRPAGLYRITQGLHVTTGLVSIPLLLAKLWTVYPKLWEWPPARSVVHAVERLMLFPLVAGGLFMLISGVANVARSYPYSFFFPSAHYAVAWITFGAMAVHLGVKWHTARSALRRRPGSRDGRPAAALSAEERDLVVARRPFLGGVAGLAGLVFLTSAGTTVRPLSRLAALAQRRPGVGPQGLPVNKSAAGAKVVADATDPDYRLQVRIGRRRHELSIEDLRALPRRDAVLPIACVEGWSTSASWAGVRVRDVLRAAGLADSELAGRSVRVVSLQKRSRYAVSVLEPNELDDDDTLLALELNGETLHLDHGYPVRLIMPNRPGVSQTKWVSRLEVR